MNWPQNYRARRGDTLSVNVSTIARLEITAHGAGKPPRRLRAAPLHRGDKDGGLDGGCKVIRPRRTQPTSKPSSPIPSVEGCPRRGGVVVLPISREVYCIKPPAFG
ncbi:MAG: hypothetical protein LBM98_06835 [Oscillospiraceae bacterium]|nr:hypothetical protein [Oscillospiraceae bacterium]